MSLLSLFPFFFWILIFFTTFHFSLSFFVVNFLLYVLILTSFVPIVWRKILRYHFGTYWKNIFGHWMKVVQSGPFNWLMYLKKKKRKKKKLQVVGKLVIRVLFFSETSMASSPWVCVLFLDNVEGFCWLFVCLFVCFCWWVFSLFYLSVGFGWVDLDLCTCSCIFLLF